MSDSNETMTNDERRSLTELSPFALAVSVTVVERAHRKADQEFVSFEGDVVKLNTLKRAAEALEHRIFATVGLILESKAETLADAAAMLLHAASNISDLEDHYARQSARAILSAFFVVASAANIDIDQIGFDYYSPFSERPPEHFRGLLEAANLMGAAS